MYNPMQQPPMCQPPCTNPPKSKPLCNPPRKFCWRTQLHLLRQRDIAPAIALSTVSLVQGRCWGETILKYHLPRELGVGQVPPSRDPPKFPSLEAGAIPLDPHPKFNPWGGFGSVRLLDVPACDSQQLTGDDDREKELTGLSSSSNRSHCHTNNTASAILFV